MNNKLKCSVLFSLFAVFLVCGQQFKLAKAEKKFNNYAFVDAIASFERLVEKGYASEDIYKKLGDANYLDARYKKAAEWYEKLLKSNPTAIDPEHIYRYAQCLKSLGRYEESNDWMEKFEGLKSTDSRALKFSQTKDYLLKIKENSGRYDIENLKINSNKSDFAPSLLGDMLVFSTARDTGLVFKRVDNWDRSPYLNLYSAKLTESGVFEKPIKFGKNINTKTHESSSVFTKDGNTMYFTRNNSKNGRFVTDADGLSRLKIYKAIKQNNQWTNIQQLPFNSDDYSIAHPALNADETKLYFASDMEGTIGGSDIFVVDILPNFGFSTPRNLGSSINTEGKETFPFISDSNVLYFVSDGHLGLGGLDVFATKLDNAKDKVIVNVGAPVNSEEDDFSFIIDEKTKKGFFASNRDGGQGSDDLYAFTENTPINLKCTTVVQGTVLQMETKIPLDNVKVVLYNGQDEPLAETNSGSDGSYSFEGDCTEGNFRLIGTKDDYVDGVRSFTLVKGQDFIGADIEMTKILKQAPVDTNLAEVLNIASIYFDYDKADIRKNAKPSLDKIIAYLNKFPETKILVTSHTDSRGGDAYNMDLSIRRANATVNYLLANGVSASRIDGKGFGETKLTNTCSNGVPCTEEEHQANRRSEFIVQK
jgi:outer membrane protein OmpA-like peptidoglycan-associated protein